MMKRVLRTMLFLPVMAVFASAAMAQTGPYQYYGLTPCRVIDTRDPVSTNGGPALGTAARDFQIRGRCGVPTTAHAVSINVTTVNASSTSWLTLWPSGTSKPGVSTINFDSASGALANGAIVGLSSNTNDLSIANAVGSVNVIIDVSGYFQ